MRCRCGLLKTWPVPDDRRLQELYDDPRYFAARSDPSAEAWANRAREIVSALPHRPERVLDFGTGEGRLVQALRDLGVTAEGVDRSAAGRAAAARDHELEIWMELPQRFSRYFSAISLLHSLEHVTDPVVTLNGLRDFLEPQGLLFIEVPHAGSIDMVRHRERAAILDLPFHLHHFTPSTLERVVSAAGYTPTAIQLFNTSIIETGLGWWATLREREVAPSALLPGHEQSAQPHERGRARRRLGSALSAARAMFPGPKFQLIARRD